MKKITFLIILSVCVIGANAQSPDWSWTYTPAITGATAQNSAAINKITFDNNGFIYTEYSTNLSSVTLGNNTYTLPPGEEYMYFLIKQDSSGNIQSVMPSVPNGQKIIFDASGNTYHVGNFAGTLVLGNITLTGTDSAVSNMFIAKADSNGNYIWAKKAEALGDPTYMLSPDDFLLDQEGNIYISGGLQGGTAVFDNLSFTASDISNVFLVKYDNNGNAIWLRNGVGKSYSGNITCDSQNNICMLGSFRSPTIMFGDVVLQNMCNTSAYIVKYDPAGNVIWAKKYGGTGTGINSSRTHPHNIAIDDMDNIYAVGGFRGDHTKFGTITLTSFNPDFDTAFMAKFDSSGNPIWAKSVTGDNEGALIRDAYVSANGSIYVVGVFNSSSILLGNTSLINQGEVDSYIAKLNTNGNYEWSRHIGGTKNVWAWDINVDEANNAVYIAGMYNEMVIGEDTFATESGINNGFLAKLSLVPLAIDNFKSRQISLYPNPAKNILNISAEFEPGAAYSITDMSGRIIKTGITENTIDVSALSSGMYNISINGINSKFIKE